MIQKDFLQEIIRQQKEMLQIKEKGMLRNELKTLPDIDNYALIVSGVRRCGKSTLLHQLLKQKHTEALYINFDDPRLYDFEISDFQKLDMIISEAGNQVLMFDEIQVVTGWERYVRQKLDESFKVFTAVIIVSCSAFTFNSHFGAKLVSFFAALVSIEFQTFINKLCFCIIEFCFRCDILNRYSFNITGFFVFYLQVNLIVFNLIGTVCCVVRISN